MNILCMKSVSTVSTS